MEWVARDGGTQPRIRLFRELNDQLGLHAFCSSWLMAVSEVV